MSRFLMFMGIRKQCVLVKHWCSSHLLFGKCLRLLQTLSNMVNKPKLYSQRCKPISIKSSGKTSSNVQKIRRIRFWCNRYDGNTVFWKSSRCTSTGWIIIITIKKKLLSSPSSNKTYFLYLSLISYNS